MAQQFVMLVFWNDSSLIHSDDFAKLTETHCPHGLCFVCCEILGREGEYSILSVEGQIFRVKPEAIREYPFPKFVKGQKVKVITGTTRIGWIYAIGWHHKNERHTYGLEIEGVTTLNKKLKRCYWEEDLEAV